MEINTVTLTGNVVSDIKTNQTGTIGWFTIAQNILTGKKNDDGTYETEANYFDCKMFSKGKGPLPSTYVQNICKGKTVCLSGSLRQEKYENKDGKQVSRLVIHVTGIKVMPPAQQTRQRIMEATR